jgi:alkanesulfonate monooxygenase SsuD/methylene tetrahydromethanopterin reductase-like flavin-dependent oxidoreductase (luciferase family)
LTRIAGDAEQAGAASLWLNDHFFQIPTSGAADDPVLEAYTTLAYLACATQRLELGTLTTGGHHRYPGPLLKAVVTVDVLSGGRFWFGIGPAWYEREQRGLGIPVLSWAERFARLEELLRLVHQVFSGDKRAFGGQHYVLEEPVFHPPPIRRPPLLVGGAHERRLFPLVARYADACSLFEDGGDTAALRFKLGVLRDRCTEVGRDFADLTRTTYGPLRLPNPGSVGEAVERFHRLAGEGIDLAVVALDGITEPRRFDRFADVIAAVAAVKPCSPPGAVGRLPVPSGIGSHTMRDRS